MYPRDVYNFDETSLYLSVLPRKTYGGARVAGRKLAKERITVGLLVNANGSHSFRPLVISKARRPRDFRPDFDPEEYCYWRHNAKGWMTAPDAWMNIPVKTIQRCWWRTGCMPRSWAMDLAQVGLDGLAPVGNGVNAALPIDLDEDIGDVGIMIGRLGLGPSAMPAAAFVAIDDDQPTCAEPGEDPLALEPATGYSGASWEAPSTMHAVYDDDNP
ncbi:unnamed protein product [Closterium sp. NIES-65]|nr:unnamed protein product [Closterium sp. NIES-65]